MSIEVSLSSTGAAAAHEISRSRNGGELDKPLFQPIFLVAEAAQDRLLKKLDLDGDEGLDLEELKALGGLGAGKNGPAGFAAMDSNGDPTGAELVQGGSSDKQLSISGNLSV